KKSGKNRSAIYKEGKDSASGRRLDMEKNMRSATVDGYKEFEVFYQPIIDVENGKSECAGAEALIRWNSENLGFVPPAEFIPLAEYLGLINPIGNFVLREACEHCRRWNENGYPEYKVNVNLSVIQLLQNDIVDIVERTLKDTGLNPANLTLEVTESLAINDMERMKVILAKIKALGVKIALDDFGTGYSSLNHIREIPFDVIKVDQSFVKDLAEDSYSQSFVKIIAELAKTIGVHICVEGIENEKQFDVLKNMNVKFIQGFLFDRPMHQCDFEKKYVLNINEHMAEVQN
ncbi:MAG: EAL domain-containing protein, partial [Lachnospiraceae bacterium]|nr:EAL domain-containing protein [Lachnospiraceae bacterium]